MKTDNSFADGQRIDIEQYNREIGEALEEVKEGKYTTHEELEQEMLHW